MNNNMGFGLQKLTLLDYPGKVACTVFTHGCDFRCPFCHNASLVIAPPDPNSQITFDELKSYLKKRQGVLDGVCVTGGEPLMHDSLFDLLAAFKELGFAVKLDTNGSYPDRLQEAIKRGLIDAVAMDVKNTGAKYDATIGVAGMYERVATSIAYIKSERVEYCEFRTTVVSGFHTPEDLEEIARTLRGTKHYFLQKFVDSGDLIGVGLGAMPDAEMRECLARVQKIIPAAQLRGI